MRFGGRFCVENNNCNTPRTRKQKHIPGEWQLQNPNRNPRWTLRKKKKTNEHSMMTRSFLERKIVFVHHSSRPKFNYEINKYETMKLWIAGWDIKRIGAMIGRIMLYSYRPQLNFDIIKCKLGWLAAFHRPQPGLGLLNFDRTTSGFRDSLPVALLWIVLPPPLILRIVRFEIVEKYRWTR